MPGAKLIVREFDFSHYLKTLVDFPVAIVGCAQKGVFDTRVVLTTIDELIAAFGEPDGTKAGHAVMAAFQYLKVGNICYFTRVGDGQEAYASVDILDDQSTPKVVFSAQGITKGTDAEKFAIVVGTPVSGQFTVQVKNTKTNRIMESYTGCTTTNVAAKMASSAYVTVALGDSDRSEPVAGTYALTGGDNGYSQTTDYIGSINGVDRTGLQLYRSSEDVDIYMLAVPGVSTEEVHAELIDIGKSRQDCVTQIDPPSGLGPQDVVDFINGEGTYSDRATLQSSFSAVDWAWIKVWNPYTDAAEYIPPSVGALYSAAVTVEDYEIFYPMAGARRGRIPWATGLEFGPSEGERDLVYDTDTNCVNPLVDYPGFGIMRFGQKTLARTQSALDRLNVRFLLVFIRRGLRALVPILLFEPNDQILWNEFLNLVRPFLASLKSRRGLYDFRAICDGSTTLPIDVDNNTMRAKVLLKPVHAAEVIIVDLNILRTGANFDEYIGTDTAWENS